MAFTTVFTSIPNGDIDVDSPITTSLMTAYRNNDQYLLEYIGGGAGGGFTPVAAHNHDGVNSASIQGQILDSDFAIQTTGGTHNGGIWVTAITLAGVTLAAGEALFVDCNYTGHLLRSSTIFGTTTFDYAIFRVVLGGINQPMAKSNTYSLTTTEPGDERGYYSGSVRMTGVASGSLEFQVQFPSTFINNVVDEVSMRYFKITT